MNTEQERDPAGAMRSLWARLNSDDDLTVPPGTSADNVPAERIEVPAAWFFPRSGS